VGDRVDFRRAMRAGAALMAMLVAASYGMAQAPAPSHPAKIKKERHQAQAAANRFSARVDVAMGSAPASKGEWGLLVTDAATGETLYELNSDKYFVPASNMKLFTTALALTKL